MWNTFSRYGLERKSAFVHSLLLLVLLLQLAGCATNKALQPPDNAALRDDATGNIRKVALVTSPTPPEIEGVTLGLTHAKGAAKGALAGAAGGALMGASLALSVCFEWVSCGVALFLTPVLAVGGGVVGGVAGGVAGDSTDNLAASEWQAQQISSGETLQSELLVRALEYGQANLDVELVRAPDKSAEDLSAQENRTTLANESIDHVLNLELLQVSLDRRLEMRGRARLISVETGAVLDEREYVYFSESRDREGWTANNAQLVLEAINRGLQILAEDAVDGEFLLYYTATPEAETPRPIEGDDKHQLLVKQYVPFYVLAPVVPDLEVAEMSSNDTAWWHLNFIVMDGPKPTFRWEAFPRDFELAAASNDGHEITNVRYELRVFDAAEPFNPNRLFVPGLKVYEARDIREPFHTIDRFLPACNDYYWTVRAKFDLDGQTRATEWAGVYGGGGQYSPWNLRGKNADRYGGISAEQLYYPFKIKCD